MKTLKCKKCYTLLGEIEKGKIHKKASVLCEKCMDKLNTLESVDKFKSATDKKDVFSSGGIFNGLF